MRRCSRPPLSAAGTYRSLACLSAGDDGSSADSVRLNDGGKNVRSGFSEVSYHGVLRCGASGVFVVLQFALFVLIFPTIAGADGWDIALKRLGELWAPVLVLLLFVSYVIGSIFRAKRMNETDVLCYGLFHELSSDRSGSLATRYFPYVESLRKFKSALLLDLVDQRAVDIPPSGLSANGGKAAATGSAEPSVKQEEDRPPWNQAGDKGAMALAERIYGSWKAKLCVANPPAFEFAQAFEARTRFFAGMLWAARWSITLMCLSAMVLWLKAPLRILLAMLTLGVLRLFEAYAGRESENRANSNNGDGSAAAVAVPSAAPSAVAPSIAAELSVAAPSATPAAAPSALSGASAAALYAAVPSATPAAAPSAAAPSVAAAASSVAGTALSAVGLRS
jgi:hypothetical protein